MPFETPIFLAYELSSKESRHYILLRDIMRSTGCAVQYWGITLTHSSLLFSFTLIRFSWLGLRGSIIFINLLKRNWLNWKETEANKRYHIKLTSLQVIKSCHALGYFTVRALGTFSQKSQERFGPQKSQLSKCNRLVLKSWSFTTFFKVRKPRGLRGLMTQNLGVAQIEEILAPEIGSKSFGTFEEQGPVLQRVDRTMHWINHYPLENQSILKALVCWIVFYSVDSAIYPLSNCGLVLSDKL